MHHLMAVYVFQTGQELRSEAEKIIGLLEIIRLTLQSLRQCLSCYIVEKHHYTLFVGTHFVVCHEIGMR